MLGTACDAAACEVETVEAMELLAAVGCPFAAWRSTARDRHSRPASRVIGSARLAISCNASRSSTGSGLGRRRLCRRARAMRYTWCAATKRDSSSVFEARERIRPRPPARISQVWCAGVSSARSVGRSPNGERSQPLLLARTRMLGEHQVAVWELPADPAMVARARTLVTERLTAWGHEELAFTTELIVSELVTNAIHYAGGPIHVRLIRDGTLFCEVSDPGHTSPHLRHATGEDEGGRGLFIIAQMAQRWGTRYTAEGKTIWVEQALPPAGER